jgi:beta-lactamase regulating signal transducer with metallopeptidase domain
MGLQKKLGGGYLLFKLIGAVLLALYFYFQPFIFDKAWFLLGLLIAFTVILFYLLTIATFNEGNIGKTVISASQSNSQPNNQRNNQSKNKRSSIWTRCLPAAEDGVFLLPLLFIGVNFISVTISAVLFSIYLSPSCSKKFCTVRGIVYFLVALFILPHGIWSAVFTNITVEIAMLTAIPLLLSYEQTA